MARGVSSAAHIAAVVFGIGAMMAGGAGATESGRNPFPLGLNGTQVGNVPPPGVYLVNEFLFIQQNRFRDHRGERLFPDFNVTVIGYAPRLLWSTPLEVLGGNFAIQVIQPVVHVRAANNPPAPFIPPNLPFGRETEGGLTDLIITPILAWHAGEFHWAIGADINIPTARFDPASFNNLGLGYTVLSPAVAFTYLGQSGLELSGKLTFDINFKNGKSGYDSGDAVFVELTANYYIQTPIGRVAPGVSGFVYRQISDDTVGGAKFLDGFRGRTNAVGPQLVYQHPSGLIAEFRYQTEFGVRNRPSGERFFGRVLIKF
jgi:hypothetical protein